jgi:hypothetical protein
MKQKLTLAILAASVLLGASPFLADALLLESSKNEFESSAVSVPPSANDNSTELGVVTDQNMKFGRVETGSKVTKYINLSTDGRGAVTLSSTGNISNYFEHPNHVVFQDNVTLPVSYTAKRPGIYNGSVVVKTYGASSEMGYQWMKLRDQLPLYY